MKIIHFTPFAPSSSGLYEAARDMAVADTISGHDTYIVDTGVKRGGVEQSPGEAGKSDDRGGVNIVSAKPEEALDADILVAHTTMPMEWVQETEAPIIWMLHGRPTACFRHEIYHKASNGYSILSAIANWKRVGKLVTFWPQHVKYWETFMPEGKLVCLDAPPIDARRFGPDGSVFDFGERAGKVNILLADSQREDVDLFELAHGCIEYAKTNSDVKFHFFAMNEAHTHWEPVMQRLSELGGLGEIQSRYRKIEEVYRAADIVLSPHKIATRVVGEALCCGTPVIAARGNKHATGTMIPDEPESVARAIGTMLHRLREDKDQVQGKVTQAAQSFSLTNYSRCMNELYEREK